MSELTDDRLREIEAWAELVSTLPPAEGHPPPKDYAEIAAICTELLARRAAASTSTEGAGVRAAAIEECARVCDAVRPRLSAGRSRRLNQIDEHVASVADSLAARIRKLTPPAPKVTTQERNA